MKKTTLVMALILAFSLSSLAEEGHVPIGGKGCPQGQTCLTDFEPNDTKTYGFENLKDIFKYLKSIFE